MTTPATTKTSTTARALRQLGLLWAGAAIAATAWAAGLPEEGFMLEAPVWRQEVAHAAQPDWPVDGWYRLSIQDKKVEVRKARPSEPQIAADPEGSFYVRVPGSPLKEGLRTKYRFSNVIMHPVPGKQYELMLGKTRFAFEVQSDGSGTQYRIAYGGETYLYPLGLPAAETQVHAVADLDGDAMPDFLLEVGDERYLLLSTRAKPGTNMPSAQMWAMHEGC
jgi:hypothetical protein